MSEGQFDRETTRQNFEWHRERALREKKNPSAVSQNRVDYNLKAVQSKHGDKAAYELAREVASKSRRGKTQYFT